MLVNMKDSDEHDLHSEEHQGNNQVRKLSNSFKTHSQPDNIMVWIHHKSQIQAKTKSGILGQSSAEDDRASAAAAHDSWGPSNKN